MKILILADPAATHTIKWVNSLSEKKLDLFLFGLSSYNSSLYNKNVKIRTLNLPEKIRDRSDGSLSKILYLKAVKKIKDVIQDFKPDIVHAHYASSFGLLGALVNFHPFIISVWGSDIFTFPSSFVRSSILRYTLSKADIILSTSIAMREETKKFTHKEILLTPFGIDTKKFYTQKVESIFSESDLVIGTIKTLKKSYGIEYLIRAFHILKQKFPSLPLKLLIVGGGDQMSFLKSLVIDLGLEKDTIFTGFINPDDVVRYHNMLDIYAAPSISESFGVAVLEASACCKPVVVSNVGGLPEVVENEKTGFIVEKGDSLVLAEAIEKLLLNRQLRTQLGENGRNKVINQYNWIDSVNKMTEIYSSYLNIK